MSNPTKTTRRTVSAGTFERRANAQPKAEPTYKINPAIERKLAERRAAQAPKTYGEVLAEIDELF